MTMLLLALLGATQPAPLIRTQDVPAPTVAPGMAPQVGLSGSRARANLASYVTSSDYPADAIRARQEGTTWFKLTIGPDGRITDCLIEKSSGSASLDAATCRIMRSRARFTPALDSARKPTSDTMSARISWRLPLSRPIPDRVTTAFTLAADGSTTDCRMEVTLNGNPERRLSPDCTHARPSGPYFEAIKQEAKGVATQVTIEILLIRDAAAPWPVLDQRGRRVVSREMARLQVAPGGQVVGCAVLDHRPLAAPMMRACSVVGSRVGQYTAAGASEMRMVIYTALADTAPR
ncbi:energy transducer TonB [Sphingomonas glaciei]|uniref:Energy transducer TonB n=1 Tax=Sphingomonas glaciei TaxID=2938948 RepID=A0ABY5N0Y8_9SPHN|nr:energy transducer TonB [Sphingomonas glaciei]UUR09227.1 energy transducer TonB [Sphingomonas glaciei]